MKVNINRQLLGVEDLLVGEGTVTQVRGGQSVTITKFNAASIPWGDGSGLTYAEALEQAILDVTTDGQEQVNLATIQANLAILNAGYAEGFKNEAAIQAQLATTNGEAQVALAAIQAELATTNGAAQVLLATEQAGIATVQAGIAILNAGYALTYKDEALYQSGLASAAASSALNSKNESLESAAVCAAAINLAWYGFEVIDGELTVYYNDLATSTPEIVDGDFIVTYV